MNENRGMGGQVVDVQMSPVTEYVAVPLPDGPVTEKHAAALAAKLTELSAAGFNIMTQTPGCLILGKVVAMTKLSVDVGRVVLPFAAPAPAIRN